MRLLHTATLTPTACKSSVLDHLLSLSLSLAGRGAASRTVLLLVSRTKIGASSSHLIAPHQRTLSSAPVPHTVQRAGLGGLGAARLCAALAPSVAGAESRSPHCRLHTAQHGAALATPVCGTEELVTCPLVAALERTASPTTM